jgi:hypothetical protein
VCGMQTPEDIAALDDGRHLLLAHFGGMIDGSGSLSLFDTQTERMKSLFPSSSSSSSALLCRCRCRLCDLGRRRLCCAKPREIQPPRYPLAPISKRCPAVFGGKSW